MNKVYIALRIALIGIFLSYSYTVLTSPTRAASPSGIDILPAVAGVGSVYDYGVHFEELSSLYGAYDYPKPEGTAVAIKGWVRSNLLYPTR